MSRDLFEPARATGLAGVLALAVVLAGLAAPASAATRVTTDERGDVRHGMDVHRVAVRHDRALTITLRHRELRDGGWSGAFVDLRGSRAPELFVVGAVGTHYDLYRADGWRAGERVECRYDSTVDKRTDRVTYVLSRGCLEEVAPGARRARVSGVGGVDGGRQDWSPGRHAYGAWVARG